MRGLGVASVAWDASGLYNYYNNPGATNVVSPGNFAINTGTTGAMTFGGAVGFGAGFYFTVGRMVYSSYENFKEMPVERQWNFVNTQMHSGTGGLSSFVK